MSLPTTHHLRNGAQLLRFVEDPISNERNNQLAKDKKGRVKFGRSAKYSGMDNKKSVVVESRMMERLARHPFVKGMERHHLEVLAQSAMPASFEKDQILFKVGEPANGFYLLESGSIALQGCVSPHDPITTDVVNSGEALGWSWLFPPYLWHFDARALEPSTAISISGLALRQHRDEDLTLSHELFQRLCEVMVRRLQHAHAKLVEQSGAQTKPA